VRAGAKGGKSQVIYEYQCKECNNIFERWSKQIRDMDWTEFCPKCGSMGNRILSSSTFILKGNGWAKDGYSSSKAKSPE